MTDLYLAEVDEIERDEETGLLPADTVPVSEEEKEKILRHALGLIREPQSWTTGEWKCPLPEYDAAGQPKVNPVTGDFVQQKDENDRPLFQYCVHGALNQATYDILGEERAIQLGAFNPDAEERASFSGGTSQWGLPATWLGIDEIAAEEYGIEAMTYNDQHSVGRAQYRDEESAQQHQGVLHLLRKRLAWMHEPPGDKAA